MKLNLLKKYNCKNVSSETHLSKKEKSNNLFDCLSKFKIFALVIAFLFIGTSQMQGQLLQWNTFGNAGTETTEPSVTNNANIAAANLNYTGSAVNPAGNSNRFGGTNWGLASFSATSYIQFTVAPNSGFTFFRSLITFSGVL